MLWLLVYFLTPLAAAWLGRRRKLEWLDPVLTCYAVGIAARALGGGDDAVATTVSEIVIPLAIPLLLFQTDFVAWSRSSRNVLIGFAVAIGSVITSVTAVSLLSSPPFADAWRVSGMLTGTWIGGTANLVSVAAALDVPDDIVVLTNAADVVVGGTYLFALLTFARPLLSKFLAAPLSRVPMVLEADDERSIGRRLRESGLVLLAAAALVAGAVGSSLLLFDALAVPWVILGITTGAIAASFWRPLREARSSWTIGNYLILVFCVAIGSLTDFASLAQSGSAILGYTAIALAGVLLLHYGVCRLLKVDVDTAIITSAATIMGPPLVVPVARRLDSHSALVSGLTAGLVGYALGNYIGIGLAHLLKWLA